jgi:hypothetical protein
MNLFYTAIVRNNKKKSQIKLNSLFLLNILYIYIYVHYITRTSIVFINKKSNNLFINVKRREASFIFRNIIIFMQYVTIISKIQNNEKKSYLYRKK